jgi:hypothetical protein
VYLGVTTSEPSLWTSSCSECHPINTVSKIEVPNPTQLANMK